MAHQSGLQVGSQAEIAHRIDRAHAANDNENQDGKDRVGPESARRPRGGRREGARQYWGGSGNQGSPQGLKGRLRRQPRRDRRVEKQDLVAGAGWGLARLGLRHGKPRLERSLMRRAKVAARIGGRRCLRNGCQNSRRRRLRGLRPPRPRNPGWCGGERLERWLFAFLRFVPPPPVIGKGAGSVRRMPPRKGGDLLGNLGSWLERFAQRRPGRRSRRPAVRHRRNRH
jgi:hypothetical protein